MFLPLSCPLISCHLSTIRYKIKAVICSKKYNQPSNWNMTNMARNYVEYTGRHQHCIHYYIEYSKT